MKLVNFGCGEVFHSDWINFDVAPQGPTVRRWDVRGPLPFADGEVDAVYHSHLLEHLPSDDARRFLRECHRILRSGGVMRVAVPDLEGIARSYLAQLERAASGADSTLYVWSQLELCDQLARDRTGGKMAEFVQRLTPAQLAMVRTRAGAEIDAIVRMKRAAARRRHFTFGKVWLRSRVVMLRTVATLLGGRRFREAFGEGWFRASGEVHRVMYDRVSLGRLLDECGFVRPAVATATESGIPRFPDYALDTVDGVARKPDSLYMEAVRP